MKKEYKVGDKVYYARTGRKEISRPCPVCFGKLKVIVILGNDDHVQLDCTYCSRGYEPPNGKEFFSEHVVEVTQHTIKEVRFEESEKGRKVEYLSNHHFLEPENIFDNKEDAYIRTLQLVIDRNKADMIELARKDKVDKSYAWHAGYYLRQAKNAKEGFERYSQKAIIMKDKSKLK